MVPSRHTLTDFSLRLKWGLDAKEEAKSTMFVVIFGLKAVLYLQPKSRTKYLENSANGDENGLC